MTAAVPACPPAGWRPVRDSALIAGRHLRVLRKNPGRLIYPVVQPLVLLFLFVSVFGNLALARGGGGVSYREFLIPGIIIENVTLTAPVTGLAMLRDAGSGLADRLRALPMSRAAALAGRLASDACVFAVQAVLLKGERDRLAWRQLADIAGIDPVGLLARLRRYQEVQGGGDGHCETNERAEGVDCGQSYKDAQKMNSPGSIKEPLGEIDGFVVNPPEDESGHGQGNEGEDARDESGADVGVATGFLGFDFHSTAKFAIIWGHRSFGAR